MMTRKEQINALREVLALKSLMKQAPGLEKAYIKQLNRLQILQEVESVLIEQVNGELEETKRELKAMVDAVQTHTHRGAMPSRFVISSYLLAHSYEYLRPQPEESLHFATGVGIDNACTVDTVLGVKLAKATIVSAEADKDSLSRILAGLERLGHCLTGVLHIHPGEGEESTRPSGVDRAYMQRLSGRSVIFGIWSRDGYCRVFSLPREFRQEIYGAGVIEIRKENDSEVVYKLVTPGESLLALNAGSFAEGPVGRTVVRPSREGRRV